MHQTRVLFLCAVLLSMGCTVRGQEAAPAAEATVEITPAHRAALEYLQRNEAAVGLADASHQLRKIGERGGRTTFVRFQQLYSGVPVLGTLLTCEVLHDGKVLIRTQELASVDVANISPAIGRQVAISAATAYLKTRHAMEEQQKDAELVIVPARYLPNLQTDALAWVVTVDDVTTADRPNVVEDWSIIVDAATGQVLHSAQF